MARKPKEDDAPAPTHNLVAIRETIAEVAKVVRPLLEERAKITAQIREAKARLKALGIKGSAFDRMLKMADLEEEDDRDQHIHSLRMCFEALMPGQQSDLFPPPSNPDAHAKAA